MLRVTGKQSETAATKPVIGWRIATAIGLVLVIAPTLAFSQTRRSTTEVAPALAKPSAWTYCERATVLIEAAHKLPRALLFSVAMVESGRLNPELRKPRPWPWTINAEGQSFYFKTKKDAIAAVRRLQKEGVRSIDVGCMQINLRYHPDAFADLNEAFDPAANVTYGAKFLETLHARTDSWPEAIATYHSQSKTRSAPYFARVIGVWTNQHTRIAALARRLKAEAVAQADAPTRELPVQAVAETPVETVVVNQARPAPMVLDGDVTSTVRETAVATVGLRLSIADDDFAAVQKTQQAAPRVIDTLPAAPTVLADASSSL